MDEAAIVALLTQMVRDGLIPEDTVDQAADECEAAGEPMSAHHLRCLLVEAAVTPPTEARKAERRASFKVLDGGNRG